MKLLTHPRDLAGDFQDRVLLHIPIGFLMGLLFSKDLVKLFVKYEENEDLHTTDQAWKDYAGAIVGYIAGRICLIGIAIFIVLKVLRIL